MNMARNKAGIRRFDGQCIDPRFAKETVFVERDPELGVAVKGFGRTNDSKPSIYFPGLPAYYESVPEEYKDVFERFFRRIYKRDTIYFL